MNPGSHEKIPTIRTSRSAALHGQVAGTCAARGGPGRYRLRRLAVALERATSIRETHPWLIWLLPVAGFAVGLAYHAFGKRVEAGNNLLIDEIHDPKSTIPFRMTPLILGGTVISHLFGASVGREGTAVQMGGSLADQLAQPLAGAIFGLEVLVIGRMRYDAILHSPSHRSARASRAAR